MPSVHVIFHDSWGTLVKEVNTEKVQKQLPTLCMNSVHITVNFCLDLHKLNIHIVLHILNMTPSS